MGLCKTAEDELRNQNKYVIPLRTGIPDALLVSIHKVPDTGFDPATFILQGSAGVYNIAAGAFNGLQIYTRTVLGLAYSSVENAYNQISKLIIGQEGVTGGGLQEDSDVLFAYTMTHSIETQAMSFSANYVVTVGQGYARIYGTRALNSVKSCLSSWNNGSNASRNILRFEVSRAKTPGIANNITNAQAKGAPQKLQRIVDRSLIRANRRKALKGLKASDVTKSLDEYPFASTQQGGKGAFVMEVPVAEQNIQGGQLSSFYQNNNVTNGTIFEVIVVE